MKEKIAEWLLVLQGFRKFLITLMVIVISVIFRIKSLISGNEFVDLVKAIGLGFIAANNLEGITAVVKEHLQARRDAGSVLTTPKDKPEETDDEVTIVAGDGK